MNLIKTHQGRPENKPDRHGGLVRAVLAWTDSNEWPWTLPLPPWSPPRARALRRLRMLARRHIRARRVAYQGWARTVVQALLWPFLALVKAARSFRSYPLPPGSGSGAHVRELAFRWWLQLAHNLMIADQAYLLIHLPAYRRQPTSFITEREHLALIAYTNAQTQGFADIHRKLPFARFCAERDLPSVRPLMQGDGATVFTAEPLPNADLFLKPASSGEGEGAEIIRRAPQTGGWLGAEGVPLAKDDLVPYIVRRLGDRPWILQKRMINAPTWLGFTAGALATVRVVTVQGSGSAPECLLALLRLPRAGSAVDNISAGGLGADIDLETGRLSTARDWVHLHTHHDRHPETGEQIAGVLLPEWDAVKALALRAHSAAGNWFSLGWDVSLIEDSSCLIETNLNWSITPFRPILDTRYVEVMSTQLCRDDQVSARPRH